MDEHLVRGSVRQVRPILSSEVREGKLTPWTAIVLIQDNVAGRTRDDSALSPDLSEILTTSL